MATFGYPKGTTMTTKNVGIEFTLSGLQATEAGIDKITGQLTGLENLTGNMNVRGLQTLNKSIKDLAGNFAGLRGDLSSLTSNLNNVSTSLTGVAEKLSTAVDKMSTGTRQGMRVAKEATEQTAKAISSAAKQAESDISHLNDAVAKQQAKANDFMSRPRYVRANQTNAADLRYDHLLANDQKNLLKRLQEARSNFLSVDANGARRMADGQLQAKFGTVIAEAVKDGKTYEATINRVVAKIQALQAVTAGYRQTVLQQAVTNKQRAEYESWWGGALNHRDLSARQDQERQARSSYRFRAEAEEAQALHVNKTLGAQVKERARVIAQQALDENRALGKQVAWRKAADEAQALHVNKTLGAQIKERTKIIAQQALDENRELGNQQKRREAAIAQHLQQQRGEQMRQMEAERRGSNSFAYLRENRPEQLRTVLLKARAAYTNQNADGSYVNTDKQISKQFGPEVLQAVANTQRFSQVMQELDGRVASVARGLKQLKANSPDVSERNKLAGAGKDLKYNVNAAFDPAAQLRQLLTAKMAQDSGRYNPEAMTKKFGPQLSGIVSQAGTYSAELKKVQKAVAAAEDAHLRFGRTGHDVFRGMTSGLGMIWLSWGQILPMIAGFATSAGIRAMLQVGTQFEHQMKIIQALSQETSGALGNVQQQLLSSSSSSMFALNDMVGGLKALTQAGFSTQDAMKNLKTVMNLSLLGETSPEQSALFLAGLRNTFKNDPTISDNNGNVDLAQAANVTAMAAARSQTSIAEMMESMKQASSVADVYNLRLTDVSVALQLLAERNITGSAAGTATRNAMEDLTGRTEKARKALQQLGVSLYDTKTGTTRNAFDVMADIREKMSGFSDMKRNRFIQSFTDERGKKLIEAYLAKSDAEIRDMRAQTFRAGENGGFVTKGAEDINTGLQALSGQTLNTFRATAVETFKEINPGLKELMGNLKQLAGGSEMRGGLTALANGFLTISQVGVGAVTLLAKVGPALVGLGGGFVAARALTAVGTGLMRLQTAAASGTLLSGLATRFPLITAAVASLTTPIGLLTAALMAGGAAWMYFSTRGSEAQERLQAAKSRMVEISTTLATIRSDVYAKFNQSEQGGSSLGEDIDSRLNQRLQKINSQAAALQNLAEIDAEFAARSTSLKVRSSEEDIEREMFLAGRRKSSIRQQLDEFDQFLRAKGIKEDEYQQERGKFVTAAMDAEREMYNYSLLLSQQRIEMTVREVQARKESYKTLWGFMLNDKEKQMTAKPREYVVEGGASADYTAARSKLEELFAAQKAGKDITPDAAALSAEVARNLERVTASIPTLQREASYKSDPLDPSNLENMAKKKVAGQQLKNAENLRANYGQLLDGESIDLGSGTFSARSLKNLLAGQEYSTSAKLNKPITVKPTDQTDLPGGRETREKKGTSLLSLVEEYSGEDRGVSKLLQALKAKPGSADYKTQLEEYRNLLDQDGESGDFAKQAGSFEAYREQLHKYITEHKTLQARMGRSLEASIRGIKDETSRIAEEAIPEGSSNATSALIAARRNLQRKFDEDLKSSLKDAKSPQAKTGVQEAFDRAKPSYDAEGEKQLLARLDDLVKAAGNKAREADSTELKQRQAELRREESIATKPLRELEGATTQSGNWLTRGFGSADYQYMGEMETATLRRKKREDEAALQAEREFGLKGLDQTTELYSEQKEAHDNFLTERLANVKKVYDEEAAAAATSLERTKSFTFQGAVALNNMFKSMQSPAEVFGATVDKGMKQLQTAFYDAAKGAKVSFKDIRNGFKELMLDMLAQMAANKAMEATMGLVGMGLQFVGGLASSYFGSMFGAGATTAPGFSSGTVGSGLTPGGSGLGFSAGGASLGDFSPGVSGFSAGTGGSGLQLPAGRAAGGPVTAGRPYTVGEQGWEVFVPDVSGSIVPNQIARNLSNAGAGDNYNVSINIVDQSTKETSSTAGADTSKAADLGKQIKSAVMEVLIEQKRAGGVLSR
jgi:TP901 family phage tail tape measure protein